MRSLTLSFALGLVLFGAATAASAQNLNFNSQTYFRSYVRPGATDVSLHSPFYEFVQLRAGNIDNSGISVRSSMWIQLESADVVGRDRVSGDVNVFLLEYRAHYKSRLRGLQLRVGRQFISAGPSVMQQIDGGYISYDSPWGLSLAAYGGLTTGVRFTRQPVSIVSNDLMGHWMTGARMGYHYSNYFNLGVSFRHQRVEDIVAHEEIGWDFVSTPISRLTLISDGSVELIANQLKTARAIAELQIIHGLSASVGYRYYSPDLYLPRTSVFAVFADTQRQEISGEVHWAPVRWLSVTGEVGAVLHPETCTSGAMSGEECDSSEAELKALLRADFRLNRRYPHGATVELERLGAPEGGFWRFRLAGYTSLMDRLSALADIDFAIRDDNQEGSAWIRPENQPRWSFTGSAYFSYALMNNLSMMLGGQFMVTPLYSKAGSFMTRLTWAFDKDFKSKGVEVKRAAATMGGTL